MLAAVLPRASRLRWILASGSPRRAEALRGVGLEFEIRQSGFPEDLDWREFFEDDAQQSTEASLRGAERYCIENARRKVEAVWDGGKVEADVVIGADTVVVLDGEVLEKPATPDAATEMLGRLSGSRHHVQSGVAILVRKADGSGHHEEVFGLSTEVKFANIDVDQIRAYVDSGTPFDKAGGYGIQEPTGGSMVEAITGWLAL
jgi:nucleoside triphosphate pyrophosphatase